MIQFGSIDLTLSFIALHLGNVFVTLKMESKSGHLIYKCVVLCQLTVISGYSEHTFFYISNVINDIHVLG